MLFVSANGDNLSYKNALLDYTVISSNISQISVTSINYSLDAAMETTLEINRKNNYMFMFCLHNVRQNHNLQMKSM
jgi:hypothetical protein